MDPARFDSLTRLLLDPQSRRRLLGGALRGSVAVTAAAVTGASLGRAETEARKKGGKARKGGKKAKKGKKQKVTICHKGQTITVAEPAVPAHLRHGDTVGSCGASPPPPPICDGDCLDQPTCTALGAGCVCRTLQGSCGECIPDGQQAGGINECCTNTFCAAEGICGECLLVTCPAGPCTATSCGTGCTCVSLGGGATACAAIGICPAGTCTAGSCGEGCTCVSPGALNSRCVSTGTCPAGTCVPGGCGPSCVCLGTGLGSRCIATVG
jgi:hypothetical protein